VSAATGDGLSALWRVIDAVIENATHRASAGTGPRGRATIQGGSITP